MQEEDTRNAPNHGNDIVRNPTDYERISSREQVANIPEISIVIPTYNGERFLAETLDSVSDQTYKDWECVIVDDGSKDGSAAIALRYMDKDSRFRLVQQENGGIAYARNRGIDEINKESSYVIFLDHDDVWTHDALESLRNALIDHPDAVAAHGIAHLIDINGKIFKYDEYQKYGIERKIVKNGKITTLSQTDPTTFNSLILWCPIPTVGLVLLKHIYLNEVGSFDPSTVPADDWDMWIRFARRGNIIFIMKDLLGFRKHDKNTSSNNDKMKSACHYVYDKAAHSEENNIVHNQIISKTYRPYQLFFLKGKIMYAKSSLHKGDYRNAAFQFAYGMKHLIRYIKGISL